MTSFRSLSLASVAALAMVPALFAAQLGDPAAPLQISTWVKGKPVDLAALKGKQIAVVEFWATWCGPCRQSIPHLTELQMKFKDVVFVGISDEAPATVKKFVDTMGDRMGYTVAVDDGKKTGDAYMKAFGIDGIPHAFVVDKEGRILWQGHPMGLTEDMLTQITTGKYDLEKAKTSDLLVVKVNEFYQLGIKNESDPRLAQLETEIAALQKDLPVAERFKLEDVRRRFHFLHLRAEYRAALAAGKSDAELEKLSRELEPCMPKHTTLANLTETLVAENAWNQYYHAVTNGAGKDTVAALLQKLGSLKTTNAEVLNGMSWGILTDKKIQDRDLALARKLAKAGVDASGGKKPDVLDTYALALFESGNAAEAVVWQKKAVALVKDDVERKELEASLKKYQEKAGK